MEDHSSPDSDESLSDLLTPSRRIVIKSAAVMGLIGGLGSTVTGQEYAGTFQLGGERSGWQGVAPETIEDETNPTLQIVPGNQYQVSWENLDGAVHNFAILNEDGDTVQASEFLSTQGETQQVEFTAEESFNQYICEPHAGTMRGDFELIDEASEGETVSEEEDEDEQQDEETQEEPAEVPSAVFSLALEEDAWRGQSPEAIKGESNPTLSLEAGETYSIVWTLRTERDRHETGHNLVIYDEERNHLAYTDFLTNEGASRTLKFTADEAMTAYSDQTQMDVSGEIDVSSSGDEDSGSDGADVGNESEAGNESVSGDESEAGNESVG